MPDRSGFRELLGAEFERVYSMIQRSQTQLGLAISQIFAGRMPRITGALAGSSKIERERKLHVASTVYSIGEMVRNSEFMPLLIKANMYMIEHRNEHNYAKLDKRKGQVVDFYRTYTMIITIMESGLQKFDLYHDTWEILTTMDLMPPERREDELTYLAADKAVLEAAVHDQDIAQRDGIRRPSATSPDFETAFEIARVFAEKLLELGHKDASLSEISSLLKKNEALTKELASLKEDDKTVAGKTEAGDKTDGS